MSNQNFFFLQRNVYFLKFHCSKILSHFYLILFYFSKKMFFFFEIYCSQLTDQRYCLWILFTDYYSWDYCSRITVGHNTKIVLQHNLPTALLYCNTIFQLPSLAIHSCILQYNFLSSPSSHNTIQVLQYNPSTAHPLQYNLLCCNTILATALSCNTL